jgi:deferrochelatase/peroxidase EfeB
MVDLNSSLDLDDPQAEGFLEGIQGNILKGHGRDFTAHLFVRFGDDVAAVRRWIADFATRRVTTAAAARRATQAWRGSGGPGERFAMIVLSAAGYRHLGFTDEQLPPPGGPPQFVNPARDKVYFQLGMQNQDNPPRPVNDPPVAQWESPYQGPIHAMVLLADDEEQRLLATLDEVKASAAGVLVELTTECGRLLRKKFPRGKLTIEHFGFQTASANP